MINMNKITENERLKELLKKINEDNSPELDNEILEEIIMKTNFISYINSNELESTFGNINFNVLKTDDDKVYLPAFTDAEELSKWGIPENMNTITLNFDDYVEIILDNDIDGLAINPFGDYYIISKKGLEKYEKREIKS